MSKPLRLFAALSLISLMTITVLSGAKTSAILQNGGFEQVDASAKAESWYIDYWNIGSRLGLTDQKARTGKYAAFLQSTKQNDIRLVQVVPVEPETVYRFSGWVATENVPEGGVGASLCVLGGFIHSDGVTGTREWTPVELIFRTHRNQQQVVLGVRLGFYGQTTTGIAYFDDLKLEKVTGEPVAFQQIPLNDPQTHLDGLERPSVSSVELNLKRTSATVLRFLGYPTWMVLFYFLLLGGIWFSRNKAGKLLTDNAFRKSIKSKAPWLLAVLSLAACLIRIPLFKSAPFLENSLLTFGRINATFGRWLGMGCDLAAGWLIYLILKPKRPVVALCLAAASLLLPAVIYDSAHWGMLDSGYILLILASIFFLTRRQLEPAVFLGALAICFNPQGLILAFLLLTYIFKKYGRKKGFANFSLVAVTLVLSLFFLSKGNPVAWLNTVFAWYSSVAVSNNAGNLVALFSAGAQNFFTPTKFGMPYGLLWLIIFLIAGIWGYSCFEQRKSKAGLLLSFAFISLAFATLAPGINERGFLPVLVLFLLIAGFLKSWSSFFGTVILSITCFFNLYAAVNKPETLNRILYIIGIVNCSLFLAMAIFLHVFSGDRPLKKYIRDYNRALRNSLDNKLNLQPFPIIKKDWLIVGAIVLCYAALIFFRLGSRSTPQTGLDLDWPYPGVEVVLAERSDLKSIVVYDAEGTGNLLVEKYAAGVWTVLTSIDCKDYYVLKRIPVSAAQVEKIRLTPQGTAGHINEIAFMNQQNEIIPIKSVIVLDDNTDMTAAAHPLFDEQAKMSVSPSYLTSTYFDEIYHGRTAYEFIKGAQVYETTHPPLGKDILSLGILLFGMNPFGMRFMHAVMGIFLIFALFFLGRQVLATRFGSYATMLLGFLDFMPFVQSRYSTIDTTSVLFISLMFLYTFKFIREQEQGKKISQSLSTLILLFGFTGLAIAVKWTAVYGLAGVVSMIAVIKFRQYIVYRKERFQFLAALKARRIGNTKARNIQDEINSLKNFFGKGKFRSTLCVALLVFLLVTPITYYLTYIPYLNCQGITEVFSSSAIRSVLNNQKGMYDYHSRLVATHPFASSWWSWPFNFKPLWIYSNSFSEPGMKGTIVSMGNPLIWYLGVLAVTILLYQLLILGRFSLLHLVLVGFLSLYLPWILVSRITYIYHYYPSLPLVLLMVAFLLEPFWNLGEQGRRVVYTVFTVSLLLLIAFYPALSGIEVPQAYIDNLRWFPRDWLF